LPEVKFGGKFKSWIQVASATGGLIPKNT